jgi:large subunit ribosomal protein L6
MSRVGKNPVDIPSGVELAISGRVVTAKGKLGEMSYEMTDGVSATLEDNRVVVQPVDDSKAARAMWGTTRARLQKQGAGDRRGWLPGRGSGADAEPATRLQP